MSTKQIKIPQAIQKKLFSIKNAEGYLLSGSQVLNQTATNSDWDFFVLLKDGSPRWRRTWKVGNTWSEVFCNDRKQIIKKFHEEPKDGRGITTFMFVSGQIIKDKNGKLKKLVSAAKKVWRQGPAMGKHQKQWIDYNLATYIQDIEDCLETNNAALLLFNQALNEIVRYQYHLQRIWLPRNKDRMRDLKKRWPKLHKLVIKFNSTSNWKTKAIIVILAAKLVAKDAKLKLSGEEYTPPEKK